MADGDTVYASAERLYVATIRWPETTGDVVPNRTEPTTTAIHSLRPDRRRRRPLRGQRDGPWPVAQPVLPVGARRRAPRRRHRGRRGLRPAERVGRARPARRRRSARGDRCGGRPGSHRADPRGAVPRRARVRRHVPSDRPAVRARPPRSGGAQAGRRARRSRGTRPTCTRSATAPSSASARTRRPMAARRAASSRCSTCATPCRSCPPVDAGRGRPGRCGVRPSRLPVVGRDRPGRRDGPGLGQRQGGARAVGPGGPGEPDPDRQPGVAAPPAAGRRATPSLSTGPWWSTAGW